jgi:hypothetical protein
VRGAATGLIALAERPAGSSWVIRESEGDWYADIDAGVMLVQALKHRADHRSHICTILTSIGVESPALDAWAWGDDGAVPGEPAAS